MDYLRRLYSASLRQGWPLCLVVTGIFGLGVLMGVLGAGSLQASQLEELHHYMQVFLERISEIDVDRARMAQNALYDNLLAGAIMYILGLTIICLPLVLAFIFIRGFVLGFTAGFLASEHELQGYFIILMSVLPHNIFYVPALIIGGTASVSFSILLIKRFFNSQTPVWPGLISYTVIMTGVMAVFFIAALTEAHITPELTRFSATFISGP